MPTQVMATEKNEMASSGLELDQKWTGSGPKADRKWTGSELNHQDKVQFYILFNEA